MYKEKIQNNNLLNCHFCGKNLNQEYYFSCKKCSEIYCFIHKSKHLHKTINEIITN